MRNLELLYLTQTNVPVKDSITHFILGADANNIFFVTESNVLFGYHPSENKIWLELSLTQHELLEENSKLIGIDYIPDLDSVCMVSRNGEIIVYELATNEVCFIIQYAL